MYDRHITGLLSYTDASRGSSRAIVDDGARVSSTAADSATKVALPGNSSSRAHFPAVALQCHCALRRNVIIFIGTLDLRRESRPLEQVVDSNRTFVIDAVPRRDAGKARHRAGAA